MASPVPDLRGRSVCPSAYAPAIDAAIITGAALALRIVVAWMTFRRCPPATQILAHSEMLGIARSLAAGHGFASPFSANSGPTAFISPGYPLFLAGILRIFGVTAAALVAVVALQFLFSTLTVWLTIRVAQRHFDNWTAIIAGCFCGFSLSLAIEPFWVWESCLSSLLLVALFAFLSRLRTKTQWAAAGAGIAIATLINPALFPALFFIAIWQGWRSRVIPWLGILTFLLVYAPWPARNLVTMHAAIPFRSNFGYELWMGNHPGADGRFHHDLDPEENPQERARFVALGELGYMRMKTNAAHDYIENHPAEFFRLTLRRIVDFWTAGSEGDWQLGAAFSLLAFSGLALLWRSRPELRVYAIPLAIYPLPYYFTHADGRFRHMIDPLLAILAARAILAVARTVTARVKARQPEVAQLLTAAD